MAPLSYLHTGFLFSLRGCVAPGLGGDVRAAPTAFGPSVGGQSRHRVRRLWEGGLIFPPRLTLILRSLPCTPVCRHLFFSLFPFFVLSFSPLSFLCRLSQNTNSRRRSSVLRQVEPLRLFSTATTTLPVPTGASFEAAWDCGTMCACTHTRDNTSRAQHVHAPHTHTLWTRVYWYGHWQGENGREEPWAWAFYVRQRFGGLFTFSAGGGSASWRPGVRKTNPAALTLLLTIAAVSSCPALVDWARGKWRHRNGGMVLHAGERGHTWILHAWSLWWQPWQNPFLAWEGMRGLKRLSYAWQWLHEVVCLRDVGLL